MNIIIPLGGKGERFQKEGYKEPKPLIKVFDKEMIFHVLDNLNIKRIDNIYIIYHHSLDEHHFCNILHEKYPEITFIKLAEQTLGAAETIKIGLEYIMHASEHKKCILLDCDTFYKSDILEKFRNIHDSNAVFYFKNYDVNPIFSYILLDDSSNKIIDVQEKIKISDNANVGVYCFRDAVTLYEYCSYIISNNIMFKNEYYTSCVISKMLDDGHHFIGIELKEEDVINLGTPKQMQDYITKKI
jgi:dTDP-glucose pyrophosphorylase